MSDHDEVGERVARAMVLADDNRLRAALLLDRWAGVLVGQDANLARALRARSKEIIRMETHGNRVADKSSANQDWRSRRHRDKVAEMREGL